MYSISSSIDSHGPAVVLLLDVTDYSASDGTGASETWCYQHSGLVLVFACMNITMIMPKKYPANTAL